MGTHVFFWITFFFVEIVAGSEASVERQLTNDDYPGFISINCGSTSGSYYDEANGLNYSSDDSFISTGTNMNISSNFITHNPEDDLYKTLRSFPRGQRNCYHLVPLQAKKKYLIRARFMYGNYDGHDTVPQFRVYIGVNVWFTVKFKNRYQKLVKEIIHYSVFDSIDVCLVRFDQGNPFISALELRPLDDAAYIATSNFSLNLWIRWDVGPLNATETEEKDDTYNRLWTPRPCFPANVIQTNGTFAESSDDPYKVPGSVLSTACEQNDNSSESMTSYINTAYPNSEIYAYWHFAELVLLDSKDTREFNINVPHGRGYEFGPIRPKYMQTTTIKSDLIQLDGSDSFVFSLNKKEESKRYPILNAVEIYKVLELSYSPTNQEDVDAITAIKDKYTLPNIWQGDPCVPQNYQWEGLICTYNGHDSPRITSLNLSSRNLTGEIPQLLFKLKLLKFLNLSNSGLTGKIPDFLAQMPLLIDIDLTGNNLTGQAPSQLIQRACNGSIILRLDDFSGCEITINNKNHRFVIPLVTSVASISILVIICVIFFTYKRREKLGIISQTLKSRNKRFRYLDIIKITDHFKMIVGKGGFGTVYHGVLQDGTQVAVKMLNNTSAVTMKQFCAEAELLTKIHHVNLVSLVGYCEERSNMALVYEFLACGNLKMHLSARNNNCLSWKARLTISIDAAQGLEYLHSGCQPRIIHRDVKPENILLDEMGHAKISDLGLSRFFTSKSEAIATTDIAGTYGYLDPEYCRLSTISEKVDVYAFGVVLLELITGKPAIIKKENRDERIHLIKWATEMAERGDIFAIVDKRLQGEFSSNMAWKCLEIAMACVNLISDQRPRMREVVSDLKLCYSCEGYSDNQNAQTSSYNENGCVYA